MEITLELIVFTVLAVFTAVSALLAVTTKRILRAATYLLFVLLSTSSVPPGKTRIKARNSACACPFID